MFGIDESPTNFRQQTQPHNQDTTPEGGDMLMPEPLSRAERKKKQDEALKALIAQDLGHDTDQTTGSVSSSPVVADIAGRVQTVFKSLIHHDNRDPLADPEPVSTDTVSGDIDGTDELITLMTEENTAPENITLVRDTTTLAPSAVVTDENTTTLPENRIPLSRDMAVSSPLPPENTVDDSDNEHVTLSRDTTHEEENPQKPSSVLVSPSSPVARENSLSDLPSPHDSGVEDTSGYRDHTIFFPAPPMASTTGKSSVRQFPPRRLLIIFTLLLVCVVLGFEGVHVFTQHVSHECTRVNSEYATKWNVYEKTLDTARSVEKSTGADAVADKATLTKLHALISKPLSKSKSLDCAVSLPSVFQVHDAVSHRSGETATLTDSTTAVETAVRKVRESAEQKKHDTALQALKTTLEEATSLYTSSDGQVADNATRDALKTRIDTAQKLSMNMKATVDELTKALAPLSDAMNEVNQSIQAKAQADEQARQAQAQAEAQAQQQQSQSQQSQRSVPQRRSSGGSTQRRSGGNSGGSSGSSGSWSVPGEQGEAYLPGSLG